MRLISLRNASVSLLVALPLALVFPAAGSGAGIHALGESFIVTREDDPPPDACVPSDCSLREAIEAAEMTPERDTVLLPAGDFVLSRRLPAIGTQLDVLGAGSTQSVIVGQSDFATADFPIFYILASGSVSAEGVTLRGHNGTIHNLGTVILRDAAVTGSNAPSLAVLLNNGDMSLSGVLLDDNNGELILSNGTLTVADSLVTRNDGAQFLVQTFGPTSVVRTRFEHNDAATAIIFNRGRMSIEGSTFHRNRRLIVIFGFEDTSVRRTSILENEGVGVFNDGDFTMQSSTVAFNSFGGVLIDARPRQSPATIVNSTITRNRTPAIGGGLRIEFGARVRLSNVTIADNSADGVGGGVYVSPTSELTASNTVISDNTSSGTGSSHDCAGTLDSGGYILLGQPAGCNVVGETRGIIAGRSAKLGPLTDNGGPTQTRAPLPGSPLIDAGAPGRAKRNIYACEAYDQRGESRRYGRCDIGAYEVGRRNRR